MLDNLRIRSVFANDAEPGAFNRCEAPMIADKVRGKATRRISVAVLLVATLVVSALAFIPGKTSTAYADGPIGRITLDPEASVSPVYSFDTFGELATEVKKLKGQEFEIEMLSDWNATERLEIPANAHATLFMNGHMIDRGLTHGASVGAVKDGEVIIVQEGAVLTIDGGDRSDGRCRYSGQ